MGAARGASRGHILLEAVMTSFIIAGAMTALASALIMTVKSNVNSEASVVSVQLSLRLLEEIRLRRWDERTKSPPAPTYIRRNQSSTIGRDGGESAADKRDYDDIDDFNGWTESPPKDPVMGNLAQFDDYTSSVTVSYLNITTLARIGTKTDFKGVTVCSWRKKRKSICLDTIITNR